MVSDDTEYLQGALVTFDPLDAVKNEMMWESPEPPAGTGLSLPHPKELSTNG